MYINLSGLNILVTGASRGIGKAVATKLAEAGATIAIHYNKNVREAENLAHILGNESKAFQADLSLPDEASKLFDRIALEMGSIEIVINNAGVAIPAPINASEEDWQKAWDDTMMVNLTSPAVICRKAIDHFLKRKSSGRIINISSRAAFRGDQAEYMAYAASKAGLVSLTKSIARAYGKDGIKAFVIAPGFVRTDMAKEFMDMYGEEHTKGDVALERLTEPKDLAPLITFIASGMADHSTGSTFDINAGSYMH
ncbi:SDR family NAD(P)-dependent oxidoreductase [Marinoscillum sp. 108]|jgi:NAD(P)-dependent dehydrogenase (short-subunit alcohol dehydrogenase family)|uniref:SDR family NAD(P)-dependent oxidoreductase n=1 Tax=Marinoscillum luteum TaxID=861051 RepID=A0ABW7N8B3_9BACT|nr:SDR family oxidoreductase [Marinoscillum sp. 108]VXD18461.1 NAD(P)-dependent dehydrogenase (Short-subunit alcohol dehydrogenase family) [Marinoscillum sp. 108]